MNGCNRAHEWETISGPCIFCDKQFHLEHYFRKFAYKTRRRSMVIHHLKFDKVIDWK